MSAHPARITVTHSLVAVAAVAAMLAVPAGGRRRPTRRRLPAVSVTAVPVPVPQQPVHPPRRHKPHRAARQAARGGDAGQHHGREGDSGRRMTATTDSAPAATSSCTSPAWTMRRRCGAPTPFSFWTWRGATPAKAPIVVIDQATGARQLIWTELDANATGAGNTDLIIHPGKDFTEGHTYIVALRNLRTAGGRAIGAPRWFARLRDGRRLPALERSQRTRYDAIFGALSKAGIARKGMYEAWNFTIASEQDLTGRMLAIRNAAFAQLGDHDLADSKVRGRAPSFQVTGQSTLSPAIRTVTGTYQVPCYLVACGDSVAGGFHYSSSKPDALPTQIPGNVATARFECIVPSSASPANPARISLYGHGLLGSYKEVEDGPVTSMASEHNMVFCATYWTGLAEQDQGNDAAALANLNLFPAVVDRLQQGVLNMLFLGRVLLHPERAGHQLRVSVRRTSGDRHLAPLLRRQQPGRDHGRDDHGRGAGLPSRRARRVRHELRQRPGSAEHRLRSVRRDPVRRLSGPVLAPADPRPDAAAVGPRGPRRLRGADDLAPAARHAVAPGADADRLRRSPGQHLRRRGRGAHDRRVGLPAGARSEHRPAAGPQPVLRDPGDLDVPVRGSAIEVWDSGAGRVKPPPVGNIAPVDNKVDNIDPHPDPRNTPLARRQKSAFLEPAGAITDVCAGKPCRTSVYTP